MGIQLELPAVYDALTLEQYLTFFGRFGGMEEPELSVRVQEIMRILEMDNLADSRVQKFSIGQRQRMEIGRALLHSPRILMLDEPFIALDYEFRRQLQEYLRRLANHGHIIIITSHNLAEAKRMIDSYSLISRGVVTDGEAASKSVQGYLYHLHTSSDKEAFDLINNLEGVSSIQLESSYLRLVLEEDRYLPALIQLILDNKVQLRSLEASTDLEASYQELVSR